MDWGTHLETQVTAAAADTATAAPAHWGPYEVFSVISGVILAIVAFAPGIKARERAGALAGGVAFIAYGAYVAHQTSGTFYFPVWIFVIPFLALAYLVFVAWDRYGKKKNQG
jgi:hypothetical protein